MDAQATFSYSFTQSDIVPVAELPGLPPCPAQRLLPQERKILAIRVPPGLNPSRTWPANMRSAASSSINKPTLPKPL